MSPTRRYLKNKNLLAGLAPGDKFHLVDLMARGPRRRRVFEYCQRHGNELTCLDAAGRPHVYSLLFVSCSQYRPAGREKLPASA